MPRSKEKRENDPLSPEQRKEIKDNRERYKGYELTLQSIVEIVEKMGRGNPRALELLELSTVNMLRVIRREEMEAKLRAEASETWRIVKEHIKCDEEGRVETTFADIEALIPKLGGPRMRLLENISKHQETKYMNPSQLREALRNSTPLSQTYEAEAQPFNPRTEKDTHIAITARDRTQNGRRAIKKTLAKADEKVGQITRSHLDRGIVYNHIVMISLMRLHKVALDNTDSIQADFKMMAAEHARGNVQDVFDNSSMEERIDEVARIGGALTRHIEFVLTTMEQETGVSDLLSLLIPDQKLGMLKRRVEEEMPEGEDKAHALKVIRDARARRQKESINPRSVRKPPAELILKLKQIDLLSMEDQRK